MNDQGRALASDLSAPLPCPPLPYLAAAGIGCLISMGLPTDMTIDGQCLMPQDANS
jgi:hypothetical protein